MRSRVRLIPLLLWLSLIAAVAAQPSQLGPAVRVADGVLLYRLDDPALLSPPGPVSVQALRVDPRLATLDIARAESDDNAARETVGAIVARHPGAIAAINGGFFSMENGRPTGFLKVNGRVVSGTSRPRGAVGIVDRGSSTDLLFDRLTVTMQGDDAALYKPLLGTSPQEWNRARDAIGGAGLLLRNGRALTDWSVERMASGFDTTRHPRTMIGRGADGAIWLVTVDGRQPLESLGMSFTELQGLARRLGLRSALNLDGGGSTTMWVDGRVVNEPSDPDGPRKVSDAIVVVPRRR